MKTSYKAIADRKAAGGISPRLLVMLAAVMAIAGGLAINLSAQETTNSPATNAPVESPTVATAAEESLPDASLGRVKIFVLMDYFDPPNQNQMKSLLRSAEAQPQPNGRVLLKELQLETYREDGKTEMIVRARECMYDQDAQTAGSASRIEANSGDGKFMVEGEGFLWERTNSVFSISNRVHTIIRQSSENDKPQKI